MSYTIIGSLRSPFTRMSRLLLINNDLKFDFEVINYLEKKDDAAYLAKVSPVNKLPILIDGEQKIFDSRVIFNYLVHKHGLSQLTLAEENILTAIQSCLDVAVNLLLLKIGGLDLETDNWYVRRQKERIPLSLSYIKPWMQSLKLDDWQYPAMSLMSFTVWAENRGLLALNEHPELAEFVEKFKDSRGLRETDFRV